MTCDEAFQSFSTGCLGQRTSVEKFDTVFGSREVSIAWGYDSLGQVITADHSANLNDRTYSYDSIGNRDMTGYTADSVNQYSALPGVISPNYDDDGNATAYPVPESSA